MTLLGYILVAIGCIVGLFGDVRFLVVAYRQSLIWFFGCLLIPLVGLVFFLLNIKETWKPMLISTAGLLLAGFGCWMGGIDFPL